MIELEPIAVAGALALWASLSSLAWSALELLRHRRARRRAARPLPPMDPIAFAFPPQHVLETVEGEIPFRT